MSSVLERCNIYNSGISHSTISDSIVQSATVDKSVISANSSVSLSRVRHSTISDYDVKRSNIDSTALASDNVSDAPNPQGTIEESILNKVSVARSSLYKVKFNGGSEIDTVRDSVLTGVNAFEVSLNHVLATGTNFGNFVSSIPGGKLRYLEFIEGTEIYRCYGGGAERLPIPVISGTHNAVDFSVSQFPGAAANLHLTKRKL